MRHFWKSPQAIESACLTIKAEPCPHCGRCGTLNRHGWLRGCEAQGDGKRARRGRRIYCANRGRRLGCGRTFCLRVASILTRRRTRTQDLWALMGRVLEGEGIALAWAGLRHVFSIESAYRYRRRFMEKQFRLRELLHRECQPPAQAAGDLPHLVAHLRYCVGTCADPIAAFQLRVQEPWPG